MLVALTEPDANEEEDVDGDVPLVAANMRAFCVSGSWNGSHGIVECKEPMVLLRRRVCVCVCVLIPQNSDL